MLLFLSTIYIKKILLIISKIKKVCKLWDLNPRVQSTNDLESLPLDHSGKLATDIFQTFFDLIIIIIIYLININYFYIYYLNLNKYFIYMSNFIFLINLLVFIKKKL